MRSISLIPLATLAGAAMAAAFFLSWIQVPGVAVASSPSDLMDAGPIMDQARGDAGLMLFLLTFALGGLVAISGLLFRRIGRLLAFLAGAAPFALLWWQSQRAFDALPGISRPLLSDFRDVESVRGFYDSLAPYLGVGLYAYVAGAAILLLLAIFAPTMRDVA